MKKRTRLEIYGISSETKTSLKEIAKAENVPTGILVEPILRRYVREYPGRYENSVQDSGWSKGGGQAGSDFTDDAWLWWW